MVHDTKVNYMIQNAKSSLKITLPPHNLFFCQSTFILCLQFEGLFVFTTYITIFRCPKTTDIADTVTLLKINNCQTKHYM
jgi:hypothetical protein